MRTSSSRQLVGVDTVCSKAGKPPSVKPGVAWGIKASNACPRSDRHCSGVGNVGAVGSRTDVTKVAVALSIRGNVDRRNSCGILLLPPFLGEEEESLFLVGIVVVRDENRATMV